MKRNLGLIAVFICGIFSALAAQPLSERGKGNIGLTGMASGCRIGAAAFSPGAGAGVDTAAGAIAAAGDNAADNASADNAAVEDADIQRVWAERAAYLQAVEAQQQLKDYPERLAGRKAADLKGGMMLVSGFSLLLLGGASTVAGNRAYLAYRRADTTADADRQRQRTIAWDCFSGIFFASGALISLLSPLYFCQGEPASLLSVQGVMHERKQSLFLLR